MAGAYTSLGELIQLRYQAKNMALFRRNVRGQCIGGGLSPFRGRGVDFEEVRAYQNGDDIRSIDWRVTARRARPHTKLFREERERPVLVAIDQCHTMFFGSRLNFKSVTASETGALIAWATVQNNDRIGGIVFSDDCLSEIRPKRSKRNLMHLFHQIEHHNRALNIDSQRMPHGENPFDRALRHLLRVAHPGSQLFVVSDFSKLTEESLRHLTRLVRHNELVAVHITDPMELNLPRPGLYPVTNGVHTHTVDTGSRSLRLRYQDKYQQFNEQLMQQFRSLKVPLLALDTAKPTAVQLSTGLPSQRRAGGRLQ